MSRVREQEGNIEPHLSILIHDHNDSPYGKPIHLWTGIRMVYYGAGMYRSINIDYNSHQISTH